MSEKRMENKYTLMIKSAHLIIGGMSHERSVDAWKKRKHVAYMLFVMHAWCKLILSYRRAWSP